MGIKILVSDVFHVEALACLKAFSNAEIVQITPSDFKPEMLADVDAWILRSRTKVDERALAAASRLKIVVTATSGFDHIDLELCKKKAIAVSYTPTANAESAAQLTLNLILSLSRGMHVAYHHLVKKGWRDDLRRGFLINGKTVGLLGLGRVGSRVAELLKPFGVKIIAFDPYIEKQQFQSLGVEQVGRSELFISSDIISLHVPLTKETRRLINHQTLRVINNDCYLINTSRGEVVDESELAEALNEGLIRGVALDVMEKEPLPAHSNLRGRPNVLMTPHIGAFTEEALRAASMEAAEKVISHLKGGAVSDLLPESVSWYAQVGAFEMEN